MILSDQLAALFHRKVPPWPVNIADVVAVFARLTAASAFTSPAPPLMVLPVEVAVA